MNVKPRKLSDQIIVVTGASSGIGLTTAQMAAERGATVVLSARSGSELDDAAGKIRSAGGRATAVTADVTDPDQVDELARRAVEAHGRIDTWVNNAGLGMYGRLLDQPMRDKRQLFEVNFWGLVYGCRAALRTMRQSGGVIVNVGSEVSDRAAPMLGMYSAAKQAVRGYTDALRMELEHDRIPVWVTLVKPGPIDTPFPQHAANYMDREPKHAPPVYPPEEVARAILTCAEKPVREVTVGGVPRLQLALATIAPRLTDVMMERQMWDQVKRSEPPFSADSLREPSGEDYGRRRGRQPGHVMKSSAYTRAVLSDAMRAAPLVAVGAVLAAVMAGRR
jgi:short-subunit dehydrogenase